MNSNKENHENKKEMQRLKEENKTEKEIRTEKTHVIKLESIAFHNPDAYPDMWL